VDVDRWQISDAVTRALRRGKMYPEYPPYAAPVYPPPPRPPVVRRRPNVALRLAVSLLATLLTLSIALMVVGLAVDPQLVVRVLPIVATRVTGTIYGENLAQISAGDATPTPLAGATIVCGATRASADAQGRYSVQLLRGRAHTCEISAPLYTSVNVSLSPRLGDAAYRLDLGPAAAGAAASAAGASTARAQVATGCAVAVAREICPALALVGGALSGQVTESHTYTPIAHAPVFCWDDTLAAQGSANAPTRYTTSTDSQGRYKLANTPPGPYLCVANQQGAPQRVVVAPAATTAFNFVECGAHCSGGVSYHAGAVMHTFAAYVIFWAPPGVDFEPGGHNARFQSLVQQYFTDVGGTRFYGLLSQYWDQQGPVRNVATLGGTYLDQQPYPHAGTRANPLSDNDIVAEINRVRGLEGWKVTAGAAFIVLTGYNVQECATFSDGRACTFPDSAGNAFCAYHTFMPYATDGSSPDYMPYIYVANNYACSYLPTFNYSVMPYGDQAADGAIDSLSHEQFETVTDPDARGWFDDNPAGGEMADKCETTFGQAQADGSTVTLNHGHGYVVQEEYSDRAGGCAYQ
jgi:hypothetical protein